MPGTRSIRCLGLGDEIGRCVPVVLGNGGMVQSAGCNSVLCGLLLAILCTAIFVSIIAASASLHLNCFT